MFESHRLQHPFAIFLDSYVPIYNQLSYIWFHIEIHIEFFSIHIFSSCVIYNHFSCIWIHIEIHIEFSGFTYSQAVYVDVIHLLSCIYIHIYSIWIPKMCILQDSQALCLDTHKLSGIHFDLTFGQIESYRFIHLLN